MQVWGQYMWLSMRETWAVAMPRGGRGNPLQYSCLENPHGQRSLAGYSPWGQKELAMTERLSTALTFKSLIHFEFVFVYGVREYSKFILLHVDELGRFKTPKVQAYQQKH